MTKPYLRDSKNACSLVTLMFAIGAASPVGANEAAAVDLPIVLVMDDMAAALPPLAGVSLVHLPSGVRGTNETRTTRLTRPLTVAKGNMGNVAQSSELMEDRLYRVTYGLRVANAGKCSDQEMVTGLSFFDIANHQVRDRAWLEQKYKVSRGFGLRMVVPQSAAELAGLATGDVITSLNGQTLKDFRTDLITADASYNRIASFETVLEQSLKKGPVQITVQRGDVSFDRRLDGAKGCGGIPVFYARGRLNAWADGKKFAVTAKMMRFAKSDGELAFVIAHEMAHNILFHAERLKGQSRLLAQMGLGGGKVKNAEMEADTLAVAILLDSGFPLDGALSMLTRAGSELRVKAGHTHPGITRRLEIVLASAAQWTSSKQALAQSTLPQSIALGSMQKISRSTLSPLPTSGSEGSSLPKFDTISFKKIENGTDKTTANLSILWQRSAKISPTAFL